MKKLIVFAAVCLLAGYVGAAYVNLSGNTVEEFPPLPREPKVLVVDELYVLSDDGLTYLRLEWDTKGGARGTPLTPSEATVKGLLAPTP